MTKIKDLLPKIKATQDEMLVNFEMDRKKFDRLKAKLKKNGYSLKGFFNIVADDYLLEK